MSGKPVIQRPDPRWRLLGTLLALSAVSLWGCGARASNAIPPNASPPAMHLVRQRLAAQGTPRLPLPLAAAAPGVPNFHIVHPWLFRGAAPSPQGMDSLERLGVRTVIDLRISPKRVRAERQRAIEHKMQFINLPMGIDPPTPKELSMFLSTVTNPAAQPVFVHCQYGADRTGAMVGIYREKYDHWSFPRTYAEMRHYGFKPFLVRLKAAVRRQAQAPAGVSVTQAHSRALASG